eukprot:TRINITY_DN12887_c0_g2_i2.p1 TRINITY_DN12887_c0_g2~~TRINITY_DN12887_c0_g2_i2.p1  ORF type:complete len:414 (-),score=51.66 TRINITY_DN12887_c0_g2_i2:111-1277(-)
MVQSESKQDEQMESVYESRQQGVAKRPIDKLFEVGITCLFGVLYLACSSGLIAYNKYLIQADRFPFPLPLVLIHSCFCSMSAGILFFVAPWLLPSLTARNNENPIGCRFLLTGIFPIAVLFSVQLVLSNTAYLHLGVAFLQMMKEANLVLVYVLSLAVSLQKFNWITVAILGFVFLATLLTIHGELDFSLRGFLIQGIGQVFECIKIVMQSMVLSAATGHHLDPLSYVLLVMPMCFVVLGSSLCVLIFLFPHGYHPMPGMYDLLFWLPHLAANAALAFALNVVIAVFVKRSSAVAFILCGTLKDVLIVLVGCFALTEAVSFLQAIGFALQVGGILFYSLRSSGLLIMTPKMDAATDHGVHKDYGSLESGRGIGGGKQKDTPRKSSAPN